MQTTSYLHSSELQDLYALDTHHSTNPPPVTEDNDLTYIQHCQLGKINSALINICLIKSVQRHYHKKQ